MKGIYTLTVCSNVIYIHYLYLFFLQFSLKNYLLYVFFIFNTVLYISSFIHKYRY